MLENVIRQAVTAHLKDAQLDIKVDGNHVQLLVVSAQFEGLSPVKRQQLVYAALQDQIASGVIHAVQMRTLTPSQNQ